MCFNTLSSRNTAILLASVIAHGLRDDPVEAPRLESFSKGKSPCLENWEALTLFFNHAEVYHVAPNVEICPADVSDLMLRRDQQLVFEGLSRDGNGSYYYDSSSDGDW